MPVSRLGDIARHRKNTDCTHFSRSRDGLLSLPPHTQKLIGLPAIHPFIYANLVWMISGFSCQSLMLTHIYHMSATFLSIPKPKARTAYLPKRAQSRQNTTSNPRRVLPLRRRKDLDPHILDGESLHFVEQTVTETLGHRGAARKHNIAEQRLA